jgi:Eco57I restriction-modification methylase
MSRARAADKQHRWLSLVEVTGVVLSEPVLADIAPAGFRSLEKKELAQFYKAREVWNLPKGMVEGDPDARWGNFVLEELLRLKPTYWQIGAAVPERFVVSLSQQREVLRPTRVLMDQGKPALLFIRVPTNQSLDSPWATGGSWKASPTTKLERLLRETGVEVGLLTNGEAWRLVIASPSETSSWLTWTAQTWADSPSTLAAFVELLGEARFFAGPASGTILELVKASRKRQADVAGQLGKQVREALETFVRELDRIHVETGGSLLKDYGDEQILESAVVFLMRLLFILKAEETGLLPHGTVAYDRAYGLLHLLTRLENADRLSPEKLKTSFEAYSQLLATFRVVYSGSPDPDIHIAPFLGGLFDPDRYPLLEGRQHDGAWPSADQPQPLAVRDSIIREILRSLKYVRGTGNVVQWVSFAQLEVEHIGHMYEGLLDRKLAHAPATEAVFLLSASGKAESATLLESELRNLEGEKLVKRIGELTEKTKTTVTKLLEDDAESEKWPSFEELQPALRALALPIRKVLRRNGVVRPAGIYVTAGESRRSQGAHYTPPTLTEPIVRRTLGPIVYRDYSFDPVYQTSVERMCSPRELLDIKICDPAMGSGAFLVQAVRYLAERVADAWDLASVTREGTPLTLPFAESSTGASGEQLLPATREERVLCARRVVVERCIYGVDRNHLAVEMAKLSLWLETLSIGKPFSFLNHALRSGDSLVGLTRRQIGCFHWDENSKEAKQTLLFAKEVAEHVSAALRERAALVGAGDDYSSPQKKYEKLKAADEQLEFVRTIGDTAVAAFFAADKDKTRESKRAELSEHISDYIGKGDLKQYSSKEGQVLRGGQFPVSPFHWEIEYPEVFARENPGFDAIVGNPPFMGGKNISGATSHHYLDWLHSAFIESAGQVDLVVFFIRRAFDLLRMNGTLGLIATNTVAQGDSRNSGLAVIREQGGAIYAATKRYKWPGNAAVMVSIVHIKKGKWHADSDLDEKRVKQITAFLVDEGPDKTPASLRANEDKAFSGYYNYGVGFTFDDNQPGASPSDLAEVLIRDDFRNAERIHPIIGGEEILDMPVLSPRRKVIDFEDMDEASARRWPDLFRILEGLVKPERQKCNRQRLRELWWQFGEIRPGLRKASKGKTRLLAHPLPSKHAVVVFVPASVYVASPHVAIALDTYSAFCGIQARPHEIWARFFASSMKDDLRYTPSDCFDTFPFPLGFETNAALEAPGQEYCEFRAALMQDLWLGLTEIYNLFHSPDDEALVRLEALYRKRTANTDWRAAEKVHVDRSPLTIYATPTAAFAGVQHLRGLHAAMDAAVLTAYGWTDLLPKCTCEFLLDYEEDEDESSTEESTVRQKRRPWRYRWPDEVRDEVLARLLKLNVERAEEEMRAAASPSKVKKDRQPGVRKSKSAKTGDTNGSLLEI